MHRVPAGLPFAQAALIEPLACALHGVRDADIQLGDSVAIIGAGAQGLMQVQLARAAGAAQVIVVGRSHGRLERARHLGAHITISTLDGDPIDARHLFLPRETPIDLSLRSGQSLTVDDFRQPTSDCSVA